ncbi:MAG TPA: hypothetical protein P5246_07475, partial [Candidatus Omnitrophota bacterium]|nr:hypothetical protein [Candidatus Omnitrophota bacterium]
ASSLQGVTYGEVAAFLHEGGFRGTQFAGVTQSDMRQQLFGQAGDVTGATIFRHGDLGAGGQQQLYAMLRGGTGMVAAHDVEMGDEIIIESMAHQPVSADAFGGTQPQAPPSATPAASASSASPTLNTTTPSSSPTPLDPSAPTPGTNASVTPSTPTTPSVSPAPATAQAPAPTSASAAAEAVAKLVERKPGDIAREKTLSSLSMGRAVQRVMKKAKDGKVELIGFLNATAQAVEIDVGSGEKVQLKSGEFLRAKDAAVFGYDASRLAGQTDKARVKSFGFDEAKPVALFEQEVETPGVTQINPMTGKQEVVSRDKLRTVRREVMTDAATGKRFIERKIADVEMTVGVEQAPLANVPQIEVRSTQEVTVEGDKVVVSPRKMTNTIHIVQPAASEEGVAPAAIDPQVQALDGARVEGNVVYSASNNTPVALIHDGYRSMQFVDATDAGYRIKGGDLFAEAVVQRLGLSRHLPSQDAEDAPDIIIPKAEFENALGRNRELSQADTRILGNVVYRNEAGEIHTDFVDPTGRKFVVVRGSD